MKIQFMISIALLLTIMVIPGYSVGRLLSLPPLDSVCIAPGLSIFLLSVMAILYSRLSIPASFFTLCLPIILMAILVIVTTRPLRRLASEPDSFRVSDLLCFAIPVLVLATYVFYTGLDGLDSYYQAWDNVSHMATIRTFNNSGDWSPLANSYYASSDVAPILSSGSFYPSAWHLLCVSTVSALNIPVSMSENVVNFFVIGLVYSLGFFSLIRALGVRGKLPCAMAGVICVGVPAATWGLLTFGPLYPNLLGFSLIPAGITLFLGSFRSEDGNSAKVVWLRLPLVVIYIVGMALAHPNAVFSYGVILAPYIVVFASRYASVMGASRNVAKWTVPLISVALIVGVWLAIYNMPFVSGVVATGWSAISSPLSALGHAAFLGVANHPIQVLIPLLTFFGLAWILGRGEYRWVAISYVIVIAIYVADAGSDGLLKHLLSGFWYTDYNRTGAMVAFMASVLACLGVKACVCMFNASRIDAMSPWAKTLAIGMSTLLFGLAVFVPSIPFGHGRSLTTAFGYEITELANQNDKDLIYYDVLSPIEEVFCRETVAGECGDSLILNNPEDGSIFGYSVYGLNMYYRNCYTPSPETETEASYLVRTKLNEYSSNPEVQSAVCSIGAKYVLQLDSGDSSAEYRIAYVTNNFDEWGGINAIDEDTPGFELIASVDDIRLYKILDIE